MWSFLYVVLVGLAVVELALVTWTINFLRKYAFRPNSDRAPYGETHGWPHHPAGMRLAGISRSPRRGARPESAANQEGELFERHGEANRR